MSEILVGLYNMKRSHCKEEMTSTVVLSSEKHSLHCIRRNDTWVTMGDQVAAKCNLHTPADKRTNVNSSVGEVGTCVYVYAY